jgi:hypothetical protein
MPRERPRRLATFIMETSHPRLALLVACLGLGALGAAARYPAMHDEHLWPLKGAAALAIGLASLAYVSVVITMAVAERRLRPLRRPSGRHSG